MTTLDPNNEYFTMINTFEVDPESAEKLMDVLHEASGPIGKLPGFVSANLHMSLDRDRVVNYVQWRTRADFDAMQKNPDVQPHMKEAADLATSFEPVFYTLKYVVGPTAGAMPENG